MANVLIVSDARDTRDGLCVALKGEGHEVAGSANMQLERLGAECMPDVVVWDVGPPESGVDALSQIHANFPGAAPVLLDRALGLGGALGVTPRPGSNDFLCKSLDPSEVILAVDNALRRPETLDRSVGNSAFDQIKGNSRQLRELLSLVAKVADTESIVLVTGETGTGKELVGAAIHAASRRSRNVFTAVNSAAFPEALLESELFGHRRGAFTGATANKRGLFESTDRGTFFLDEVAEMPLSMQAKLLRFLQTGEIRPVGGESSTHVDVRLIAATNKDLEHEVRSGRFREDLYYRLNVIPIEVPPLRVRVDDIPVLAMHFMRRFAGRQGNRVSSITPEAMDLMLAYAWPGNVRELENTIERATALCRGNRITPVDLPGRLREGQTISPRHEPQSLRVLERTHILSTLEHVGWNRRRAAEILEISTTTLWRRLREFGIAPPRP